MTQVGFIGVGGIAQAHLGNLRKIDGVQVVAACDTDSARAEKTASDWGGRAYTDYREMLDKEKLDALYICVPPFAHGGQELRAVELGLPFLVEKPVEVGVEYAEQVAAAVTEKGLVTSVGYHWRYSDGVGTAKSLIGDRAIGMVLGYWIGGMPGVFWWRRQDLSGGQFVEQTTHIVDVARYLAGDVVAVYAQMSTRALGDVENFTATDVGTVTLRFASGAVGTISNACIGAPGPVGLHVYLKDETLEVGTGSLKVSTRAKTEDYRFASNPMLKEDEAFIKAVRTGDASGILSPYADALKTQRVCHAANVSVQSGEAVSV
jgi:myo-inositol 2-dehydrogenase/D-chiro-inositol 1-dehydrogenase